VSTGLLLAKCCCNPCACPDVVSGGCSLCTPSTCTPKYVRVVLSGISSVPCQHTFAFDRFYDCPTATLSGTFTCTNAPASPHFLDLPAGCQWNYDEPAGTPTFNFRTYGSAGSTCNAAQMLSQNDAWGIGVGIDDQTSAGRGKVVKVWLTGGIISGTMGLDDTTAFCGQTSFTDCGSTYTISNGTMYDHSGGIITARRGTGGTITLTLCP
jgi:hypothetical protein